ncbi:MAG: alpha/beta hydrolase-fold protein [Candidatus Eremiobacterota bacterium]
MNASLTGDVRQHRAFPSSVLGNRRDVWVYLPPGYADHPDKRYPVLYVHDGQNVFDRSTAAFGVEWGLDETAERLIRDGRLPELIIVAAANTPGRLDEYSPCPDPQHGGGGADRYGRFLVEELKPFVDGTYRTSRDAADTGVLGSSLGGLVSLHLGWTYPHVFGLVGALSPSLWWASGQALEGIASRPEGGPGKLWLDAGHREGSDRDGNGVADMVDDARELAARLHQGGFTREKDLHYREFRDGAHNEASWGARAGEVLQALFRDRS